MLIGVLNGDATVDINVHDTYYIVARLDLAMLISMLFGVFGLGYLMVWKANGKLSKWLNWMHIGLTFGGALVVLILAQLYRKEMMEYEFNNNLTLIIMLIVSLMVLGQFFFLINMIYALVKRKNKTSG